MDEKKDVQGPARRVLQRGLGFIQSLVPDLLEEERQQEERLNDGRKKKKIKMEEKSKMLRKE